MVPVPSNKYFDFYNDIYKVTVDRIRPTRSLPCRGKSPLYTERELDEYIALYAGHHYHKLRAAFSSLDISKFNQKNIEIIDWGCGQALGTFIFIEHLINERVEANIAEIILVEPSKSALKKGYSLVVKALGNTIIPVRIIDNFIDNLETKDLVSSSNQNIKIHILSNILDINYFSIKRFTHFLKNNFSGVNFFVCTSPKNKEATRIDRFFNSFCSYSHNLISHADTPVDGEIYNYIDQQYKVEQITRHERVFRVNLLA